jgi:hypothetical protein
MAQVIPGSATGAASAAPPAPAEQVVKHGKIPGFCGKIIQTWRFMLEKSI